MIRFIWTLIFVIFVSTFLVWLGTFPGSLQLTWMGYTLEMSIQVTFLLFLFFLGVLATVVWGIFWIWDLPFHFFSFFKLRRHKEGKKAFERSFLAWAGGDISQAYQEIKYAVKCLGPHDPLAPVVQACLSSESAPQKAEIPSYEALLKVPSSEIAGFYGLYKVYTRQKDRIRALDAATRALRKAPSLPWANACLLSDRILAQDWETASQLLESHVRLGILDEKSYQKKKAALLMARLLERDQREASVALAWASQAHRLDPSLVPAAVFLARLYTEMGSFSKAQKVIEKTWSLLPHGDLCDAYAIIGKKQGIQDRLDRIIALRNLFSGGEEGALAVARYALDAQQPQLAHEALLPFLSPVSKARICWMMTALSLALRQQDEALVWIVRAHKAPFDPLWTDGLVCAHTWQAFSKETGEIGGFEWKVPIHTLPEILSPPQWLSSSSSLFEKHAMPEINQSLPPSSSVSSSLGALLHQPDDPGPRSP